MYIIFSDTVVYKLFFQAQKARLLSEIKDQKRIENSWIGYRGWERDAARIVTNPGTISSSMGWKERKSHTKAFVTDLFEGISGKNARSILNTLKDRDSLTAEQIEGRTGIPLRELSTELLQLEISGKIVQIMGDKYSIA